MRETKKRWDPLGSLLRNLLANAAKKPGHYLAL
jgi:hypothetical protein